MHSFFLVLLAVTSLCSARPVEDQAELSNVPRRGPRQGFPAAFLPIARLADTTNNGSGNLTLPVTPEHHPELAHMLSSSPGVAPNGAALIASMATEMYNFWIDTEDDPVKLPVVIRRQPFPNFKWTMTPKLRHRAVLRPVQAGIINVYMWAHAMRQPTWPGHIHCSIWEHDGPVKYGLELGSLDIENFADVPSPSADKKLEAGAAADKAQANSSSNTAVSPIPVEFETRWLQCFAQFWFGKIIHQWYAENVGEEWPIGPTGILERSYDCGTASHADKFTIRLYPDSGVYSPHPMTWDALAKGMMDWINQVALKEHNPYNLPYYIVDSSGTYAMLDIELQTPSKGTATA